MKCAKCGTENREGAKFCNECAAPVEASCPKCPSKNKPGAKFCDECGTSLSPSAAASPRKPNDSSIRVIDSTVAEKLEGERKTVTVLFADIKGSMDLMEDLDPEEARAILDPALKLMMEGVQHYGGYVAQSTGDGIFALSGHRSRTKITRSAPFTDLKQAVATLEDGLAYAERSKRSYSREGFLFRTSYRVNLANALQLLGHVTESVRLTEEALQHARDSKHLFSICFALVTQVSALWRREPEVVRAQTEEGMALAEKYGFTLFLAVGRVYHGWAVAELGQVEQGVEEMEEAVARFRRMRGFPREQYAVALLADGYVRLGRSGQALSMLDAALAHVEHTGQKAEYAEILRFKGEVLLINDHTAIQQAEGYFRAALEVARAQEAKWWELRATTSLARLRDTNRRDEARAMLANIYNWFTEGFDTADLKDAEALLDELSA